MLLFPRCFRFFGLAVILLIFFLSACAANREAVSPPVSPPADVQIQTNNSNASSSQLSVHGQRARIYTYRYYPASHVYFEPSRGLYFYFLHGQWQSSVSLPAGIQIDVNDFVTIPMPSEHPYEHFVEHRLKYPSKR